MTSRSRLAAGIVLVALFVVPGRVHADEKRCEIESESGKLVCTLIASPGPPRVVRLSDDLPLVWMRLEWNDADGLSRDIGCIRTAGGIQEIGVAWVVALYNTDTGEQLYLDMTCEWPGEDPPQPPPPPPTPEQLAQGNAYALTLQPVLSPSTDIGGLTGLDSWLWCDDPGTVAADAALNGWIAAGSVEVVQVGWEINGPSGTVVNTATCGSEEAPAVTWMPETMGEHSVVVTAVWAGTWELTYNGIPMGSFPLGPLALTASAVPYSVDEYRGVLSE